MPLEKESNNMLIGRLEGLDKIKAGELEYGEAEELAKPVIEELVKRGGDAAQLLVKLLDDEHTWSSYFALVALHRMKNPETIPHIVKFLNKFEDGDHWESYEEAMYALTAIGKPAISPLMNEILGNFQNKRFPTYLVGALTEIKDGKVYDFMCRTCEDYLTNGEKYNGWFCISPFTHDFDKHEKIDAVSLLKRILGEKKLDEHDSREIKDTIKLMEDPGGYRKEMEETLEALRTAGKRQMAEFVIEEHDTPALKELEKNHEDFPEQYKSVLTGLNLLLYLYLKNNPETDDKKVIGAFSRIKEKFFSEAEKDDSVEAYFRSELKQALAIRKIHGEGLTATEVKALLGRYVEIIMLFSKAGVSYVREIKKLMDRAFGEKSEKEEGQDLDKPEARKIEALVKEALKKPLVSMLEPTTNIPELRKLQSDNEKFFKQYENFFLAIESAILSEYENDPELLDHEVLEILIHMNKAMGDEEDITDLERKIRAILKLNAATRKSSGAALSVPELRAVITRIIHWVKNHSDEGKQGYLNYLKAFMHGELKTEDSRVEYLKKNRL